MHNSTYFSQPKFDDKSRVALFSQRCQVKFCHIDFLLNMDKWCLFSKYINSLKHIKNQTPQNTSSNSCT